MGINERILAILSEKGISEHSFEKKASVGNSYLKNTKNPGAGILARMLAALPEDVSREWVQFGTGPKYNNEKEENEVTAGLRALLSEKERTIKELQERVEGLESNLKKILGLNN